jgi:hypothetical protein
MINSKESFLGLILQLFRYFPEEAEEHHEKEQLSAHSDLNPKHLEHESAFRNNRPRSSILKRLIIINSETSIIPSYGVAARAKT